MVSFECNAICVKDVKDRSNTPEGCNAVYVEGVKDGSNTPKCCNAMYVKDVEDGKRTYTHILAHNFLNRAFQIYYQILCMLKHVKDVKDYL